jgi:hypothetical protein
MAAKEERMPKFLLFAAMGIITFNPAVAQESGKAVMANTLEWADAPPAFPKGAKFAVISGDPEKEGPVVVRIRLPANYKVGAHRHPTTEYVTVLSGIIHVGMGEKLDTSKGQELGIGDFVEAQAGMAHYLWTAEPALIQVHGQGPLAIAYLNPADDPRKQ